MLISVNLIGLGLVVVCGLGLFIYNYSLYIQYDYYVNIYMCLFVIVIDLVDWIIYRPMDIWCCYYIIIDYDGFNC